MKEYFSKVSLVKYEGRESKNAFAFKFYNPEEVIMGKTMRQHLRFSMTYWHTMVATGADPFGTGTIDRTYGETDPMKQARARADEAGQGKGRCGL